MPKWWLKLILCCMFNFLWALLLLVIPNNVFAHTRWFIEGELEPMHVTEPTEVYLTVIFSCILLFIILGVWLHSKESFSLKFLKPKKPHAYERAASTFTMVIGSFLLIAGTHEYLFSPNLSISSGIPAYLIFTEILIGVAFMVGVFTRMSAILLALVWVVAVYFSGLLVLVENIWVLSTAAFIMVMGNDYFSLISFSVLKKKTKKYKTQALSLLRIGTGATLVVLGFSEKMLAPEYGMYFLGSHHWNFMQSAGFDYSDYLFTLSAGSVEILIGLIFILGIMTRINALIAIVVFTIPLFILGPIELAGHLPHFAAMFLLLFFGSGGRYSYFKNHRDEVVKI